MNIISLLINIFYNYSESEDVIFKLILISLLLIFSALISGSEVAFFSLSRAELKKAEESKIKSLNLVSELRKSPRRLLASLVVSNNFINIGIVLIFASFGEQFYIESLPFWLNFCLEILLITLVILILNICKL